MGRLSQAMAGIIILKEFTHTFATAIQCATYLALIAGPRTLWLEQLSIVEMTRSETALNWPTVASTVGDVLFFLFLDQTEPKQCQTVTFLNSSYIRTEMVPKALTLCNTGL